MSRIEEQIKKSFVHYAPTTSQVQRYELIRQMGRAYAEFLAMKCPESRELSLALTHLEEVVFWANASIARNEIE